MEEEYGRFFLSNYRGAPLHFRPDEPQAPGKRHEALAFQYVAETPAEASQIRDDLSSKEELCGELFSAAPRVAPGSAESLRNLGHRGKAEISSLSWGKEDTSPKQLRFSNVEEIEPASQDPSFPELPHAVAAAAAATVTQDLADSREERRVQDGFPERSPRRHGARPIEVGKLPETMETSLHSVMEMDEEVARNIDDFFSRDEAWRQLARHCDLRSQELMTRIHELPVVSKASKFKVTVPKPYPGVQYRRSKHLEERYSRFAENGAIVVGQLEADSATGEWLRISGNIFLPVRVGQIHILDEVIDPPVSTNMKFGPDQTGGHREAAEAWWTCCPSNAEADCGKALEQAAQPMRPEQHPR
ncbi:unnamed protein product [Cladocopium goreaui]|uniref:UBA domain-containing protein n=1 Tax=Cladocopium goreaui TaxID=2562237 RepID=A0A9P1G116_9DINO|nr:unnamed protein product [Cladocopium goreaui]